MNPNLNFNFSESTLILLGGIVFSYYTHIGWWALALDLEGNQFAILQEM